MYSELEELKRELVEEILNRYHQTRLAGDPVDFILRSEYVQEKFKALVSLYITG